MERQPLLKRALALNQQIGANDPVSSHTRALLFVQMDEPVQAIEAYQSALAGDPDQLVWRYELATLLREQGRQQESRRELDIILLKNPNHPEAGRLIETLAREAAEGRGPSPVP